MAKASSDWIKAFVSLLALAPDVIVAVLALSVEGWSETYDVEDYDSEFNKNVDELEEQLTVLWDQKGIDVSSFEP